ncbi:MAG TPA: hypothetical protein VIQ26_05565 [Microbacteriaceae bacterium]
MNRHVTLMERDGQPAESIANSAPASGRKISAAELERMFTDPDPRQQLSRTFDRLAMRVGIALLLWSRDRTLHGTADAVEHVRIRQGIRAAEAREHALRREFPHHFI